jgi:hypothetical protein
MDRRALLGLSGAAAILTSRGTRYDDRRYVRRSSIFIPASL